MNWTVSGIGKARAVSDKIANDIKGLGNLSKHDASFRDAAAQVIKDALGTQPVAVVYRVECSAVCAGDSGPALTMSVSVSIQPVAGFVE